MTDALPIIEGRVFLDAFLDLREARWRDCRFDGCVLIAPATADVIGCRMDDCLIAATPADLARRDEWAPAHLRLRPPPLGFTPPPSGA